QPRHMFNALLDWDANDRLNLWSQFNYRSRTSDYQGRTAIESGTPGYGFIDVGLMYTLTDNVKVTAGLYNLADKEVTDGDYEVVLDGRRLTTGLTIDFCWGACPGSSDPAAAYAAGAVSATGWLMVRDLAQPAEVEGGPGDPSSPPASHQRLELFIPAVATRASSRPTRMPAPINCPIAVPIPISPPPSRRFSSRHSAVPRIPSRRYSS